MKMHQKLVLLCCASSLSSLVSAATPIDGWYTNVFGGYAYVPGNIHTTQSGLTRNDVKYQSGFDVGGALGFKNNPMRYEGEVTYLKVNVNQFKINSEPQTHPSGDNMGIFGMANVYYDIPYELVPAIQPFLGVGIGYAWLQAKLDSTGPTAMTHLTVDDSVFAYQGRAGLAYHFSENYGLNIEYRYLTTTNVGAFGNHFQAHLANAGAVYRFDGVNYK